MFKIKGEMTVDTNVPKWIFVLINIVLIIASILFTYKNIDFWINSEKIDVEVGNVEQVESRNNDTGITYKYIVYVNYQYNGKEYKNIELKGTSNDWEPSKGKKFQAYVNKKNPEKIAKIGFYVFLNIILLIATMLYTELTIKRFKLDGGNNYVQKS